MLPMTCIQLPCMNIEVRTLLGHGTSWCNVTTAPSGSSSWPSRTPCSTHAGMAP